MILFNFSVIARAADSLPLRQPDPDGRAIWNMFFDKYMGRVCLIVNERYERDAIENWLKVEGYKASMYEFLDEELPDLKAQKIHRVSAVFGRASWYVDNDARTCAETLRLGIPSLVVAAPYILRPEWGGQKEIKKWDMLVTEMDSQALKAADRTWRE